MEEDKKLYKNFLNGDEQSFEKLIQKYEKNLIYFITRYVKNVEVAEDIYQTTILYLLENKEKYDFNYSFKTYIYLIAKSRALNYLKQNKKQVELSEENLPEIEMLEEIIFSKERQEKIKKVIEKMKKEYQLVIYLTKIEGFSYKETAKIMDKTEKQVKNLAFNATKTLKKLLIKEKVVEIKNGKIVKLLIWFITLAIIVAGVTYAGYVIYGKYKAKLEPTYNSKIQNVNENQVWVGTFQLAWNEFIEQRIKGPVKLEEQPKIVEELNEKKFTKEQLSEKDYYIKVAETEPSLKETIKKDINSKFGVDESLDNINFEIPNSYTIYAMLYKNFEYLEPFDVLEESSFNSSQEKVKYFGISIASKESLKKNVEVLYYNNSNDLAIKLNTKNNEEVILVKNNKELTFEDIYKNIEKQNYQGSKELKENEEVKIPYLKVDTEVAYNDLCNKKILNKNSKISYIVNAVQNVKFELNSNGGSLDSRAIIQDINKSKKQEIADRNFYFTDEFILYLKEKDKEKPYFALKVNNTDLMEMVSEE